MFYFLRWSTLLCWAAERIHMVSCRSANDTSLYVHGLLLLTCACIGCSLDRAVCPRFNRRNAARCANAYRGNIDGRRSFFPKNPSSCSVSISRNVVWHIYIYIGYICNIGLRRGRLSKYIGVVSVWASLTAYLQDKHSKVNSSVGLFINATGNTSITRSFFYNYIGGVLTEKRQ